MFTPVRTIFDTGAESNYITTHKARVAGAQIYPITAQEIVGAGQTVTNAFAAFTLRIGGLRAPCYAYVLEDASQFCYDLLLGCAWLKKFGATPRWDDDAYELTHPTEKVRLIIKPVKTEEGTSIPNMVKKLAWRLRPKHAVPSRIGSFCCVHEAIIDSDKESTKANNGSQEALGVKETFGQRLC